MSFIPQFGKTDTLASDMTISEVTSATLSGGNFTNFVADYLVVDYDVPSKREVILCTVTGTAISAITRAQEGTSAVAHTSGAKVAYMFLPAHYNALSTSSVGSLGVAQVTSDQTSISTVADLTNLTTTVTVPAGGRSVRITAKVSFAGTNGQSFDAFIKEGSTVLSTASGSFTVDNKVNTKEFSAIITPTAASHTYKLAAQGTQSMSLKASSTNPAFISVEVI